MLSTALKYLEEKHTCPHCQKELRLCHAPPVHVGDGLGWGSEYLFICLNDDCPLFVNGWKHIENQYGHVGSYRYMEIPNSNETYSMMVAGRNAFTGSEVDIEAMKRQSERHQKEMKATGELDTCIEQRNLECVLTLLLDENANINSRKKAVKCLVPLNDLSCVEPLRNMVFRNTELEQLLNIELSALLKNNYVKECPYCAELVKSRALFCKHCQKELQ